MALRNFVDHVGPVIDAEYLNDLDALRETVFERTTTKADVRTALTNDNPLEIANGGTGERTLADLVAALNSSGLLTGSYSSFTIPTVADLTAATIPADVTAINVQGYYTPGVAPIEVRRVDSQPTHLWRFRSTDRFLSTGIEDLTNGGWWEGYSTSGIYTLGGFGGKSDGVTDNSYALYVLNTYGRLVVCPAGRIFHVECYATEEPGEWQFDARNNFSYKFLHGLPKLIFDGKGTTFTNVATATYQAGWPTTHYLSSFTGWAIDDALIGAKSFILSAATRATALTKIAEGDYVMLGCLSLQYSSAPVNLAHMDFVKILTINAGTGEVTIDRPLKYNYLNSYPTWGGVAAGGAQMYVLNNPTIWPGGSSWDLDHTYKNMTVNLNPNFPSQTYSTFTGRRILLENWKGIGHSESVCEEFITRDCVFENIPEPDKLIGSSRHYNSRWKTGLNIQSSSIENYSLYDCTNDVYVNTRGKFFLMKGGYAARVDCSSAGFGSYNSVLLEGVRMGSLKLPTNVNYAFDADGVNIIYANGVFKVAKAAGSSYREALLNTVPGAVWTWYTDTRGQLLTDFASGQVIDIYEDTTYYYVSTTFQDATVPAWSSGKIFKSFPAVTVINCTGCTEALIASDAHNNGSSIYERVKLSIAGVQDSNELYLNNWPRGKLSAVTVNVIKPTSVVASPLLYLSLEMFQESAPDTGVFLRMTVDLRYAGTRVFSTFGCSGFQGNDELSTRTGPGALIAVLDRVPPDAHQDGMKYQLANYTPGSYSAYQLPVIEIVKETDAGKMGKFITSPLLRDGAAVIRTSHQAIGGLL